MTKQGKTEPLREYDDDVDLPAENERLSRDNRLLAEEAHLWRLQEAADAAGVRLTRHGDMWAYHVFDTECNTMYYSGEEFESRGAALCAWHEQRSMDSYPEKER